MAAGKGGGIQLTLTGDREIINAIHRLGKQYPKAMAGAVYKLAVTILGESLPMVPVEFGVLRASGYVSPPQGEGMKATAEIGFGTVYAIPQHERLDFRHPRGGEAKFLEKAVQRVSPRALQLLAQWVEELAKRGGGWAADGTTPQRPRGGSDRSKAQSNRLARGAANVRKRTGR